MTDQRPLPPDEQTLITLLEQVRLNRPPAFTGAWPMRPGSTVQIHHGEPLCLLVHICPSCVARSLPASLPSRSCSVYSSVPSVRALADQFLQVFRVKQVLFVPTNYSQLLQAKGDVLRSFDKSALFTIRPTVINHPAPVRTVGSLDAASQAVGFTAQQLHSFPGAPTSSEFHVYDRMVGRFQVNVADGPPTPYHTRYP